MKVSAPEYPQFLASLKATIRERQYQALRAVNHELLALYLEIGEAIYRKQEDLGWGKAVVETLAHDLQTEFPGRNGFSARNIWNMKDLYFSYRDLPKLQPLVAEISWAKNLVILARCKDPLQREFYLRAAARFGWTKAVLQHQIDNQSYEKYLLNQTNFEQALPESIIRAHLGNLIRCAHPFGAACATLSRSTRLWLGSPQPLSVRGSLKNYPEVSLDISESGHVLMLSFLKVAPQPESQPESQREFKLEQRVMALLQTQALGKKQISEVNQKY